MSRSEKTMKVNGPVVSYLRKILGWTREDLEEQTQLTVYSAAAMEAQQGSNGVFTQRVKERERKELTVGLGKGAIAAAERGGAAYPITIKILAMTLGVDAADIVIRTAETFPYLRAGQSPAGDGVSREEVDKIFAQACSNPALSRRLRELIVEFDLDCSL